MSEENQHLESVADDELVESLSDLPSPGQTLKVIREEKGLSQAKVAQTLHITAHYVNALECNEFDKLPGKTFIKGYFKAYAKLLGADVDNITTIYDQYIAKLEESEISEANVIRARKAYDQNLRWMICAALIIIVVIAVSWWLANSEDSATSVVSDNTNDRLPQVQTPVNAGRVDDSIAASENETVNVATSSANSRASDGNGPDGLSDTVSMNKSVTAEVLVARINDSSTQVQTAAVSMAGDNNSEAGLLIPEALDTETQTETETVTNTPAELPSGLPEFNVSRMDNHRVVSLESEGNDLLKIHFLGDSWVEVDNANSTRLYNDMLSSGDDLTIKGWAPFNVLFGNANVVEVMFNAREVDLSARIRSDNSARIILQSEN